MNEFIINEIAQDLNVDIKYVENVLKMLQKI